jgi:hypothetical protein
VRLPATFTSCSALAIVVISVYMFKRDETRLVMHGSARAEAFGNAPCVMEYMRMCIANPTLMASA